MIRSLKRTWIKGSVGMYVVCILTFNFFGKSTVAWTDFYYTFEKGFAFLSTLWPLEKQTLSDRLFIDFARVTQCGTWIFFILCSFNTPLWVYHQTVIMSVLVFASFGSLLAQYYLIKSKMI